jgi:SAM-dependent methyltransferase
VDKLRQKINYDHFRAAKLHTVSGARAALEALLGSTRPRSMLDVGCGAGTWLRAALDLGVTDVFGIDGIAVREDQLLFPLRLFHQQDFTQDWKLDREFDMAVCVEVAEHLPAASAETLIAALVRHAKVIFFSAAAPGQMGQYHVNCQWPEYWQEIFNAHGFSCDDELRWKIWNDARVEPWYRQNIFRAVRSPETAGREARILPVVHPEMVARRCFDWFETEMRKCVSEIERGDRSVTWYFSLMPKVAAAKLKRKLRRSCLRISGDRDAGHA